MQLAVSASIDRRRNFAFLAFRRMFSVIGIVVVVVIVTVVGIVDAARQGESRQDAKNRKDLSAHVFLLLLSAAGKCVEFAHRVETSVHHIFMIPCKCKKVDPESVVLQRMGIGRNRQNKDYGIQPFFLRDTGM